MHSRDFHILGAKMVAHKCQAILRCPVSCCFKTLEKKIKKRKIRLGNPGPDIMSLRKHCSLEQV